MNLFGSGPDMTIPKAGKGYWLSSMSAINNLLGDTGPFGEQGVNRQRQQFADNIYGQLNNNIQRPLSLAERGVTPSGADFGRITGDRMIAANDVDVTQNALLARLQGLTGFNSMALGGIQGGALPGRSSFLGNLINAGAGIAGIASGLGWQPLSKK